MKTAKKRTKLAGTEIAAIVILTILVLFVIIPFWNALVISLETSAAHTRNPFSWLPKEFTLQNYEYLFKSSDKLIRAYIVTIATTFIGTVLAMAISTTGAFVLSRQFPGKKIVTVIMLLAMFVSGGLIPTYLNLKGLGLIDTYAVIILINCLSVYNIIVMKTGYESVPDGIEEAAMIDGANDITIFVRIMLPLQKPFIATFSLFYAVGYWNNWYWPMLLINSGTKTTLQLYLRALVDNANLVKSIGSEMALDSVFSDGIKMSAVFVVMLPIMLLYPFLQPYFVQGLTVGAVKM